MSKWGIELLRSYASEKQLDDMLLLDYTCSIVGVGDLRSDALIPMPMIVPHPTDNSLPTHPSKASLVTMTLDCLFADDFKGIAQNLLCDGTPDRHYYLFLRIPTIVKRECAICSLFF